MRAAPRFDVFLGYDGIVPEASWFPVTFEIQNDGPAFNAVVELTSAQMDRNQRRTVSVELPTATTKRFVLPVFASGRYVSSWDARLLDEKGKVRAELLGVRARRVNSWDIPVLGAVTRSLPVLPEAKPRQPELQPAVARLLPDLFPDNPIALEGLATIYLSSERGLELKVNQVSALLGWLHAGGHLVVGVEQPLHITANEWLRGMLPCEITGLDQTTNHAGLHGWLTSPLTQDGPRGLRAAHGAGTSAEPYTSLARHGGFESSPMQIATATLRDGQVLMGGPGQPLAVQATRGRGTLTVLLFSPELEPFLSWPLRPFFWARLAGLPPGLFVSETPEVHEGHSSDGIFGAMVDSKQVRKLPVGWLLLLLIGYLVVIGPLDYYWLKKIDRQMLTWVTFPIYVVLFSAMIYVIGYKLRAGVSEWNELHLVDVLPQRLQAQLRGRTYASVYSPVNANYRVGAALPFASLRSEYLGIFGGQESGRSRVAQTGNSFEADLSVPVWTSQLYVSDWVTGAEQPLTMTVTGQGEEWQVTVENRLTKRLGPAKLVIGDMVHEIGQLAPGQVKTLTLPRAGTPLSVFVQQFGGGFQRTVTERQRAFGENRNYIRDAANSAMAVCFISQLSDGQRRQFITPPGLDLAALAERGEAVLLAWQANDAPVKPLNRFAVARGRRDTLWRLAVSVRAP